MSSQIIENVRNRAIRLAPLFKYSVPISEAAQGTGIPRTSAAKIYRVFRLIDSSNADDEIAKVQDFTRNTVAGIRSAYLETLQGHGGTKSITSFLDAHRKRLRQLAKKLSKSGSCGVEPWPSGWIGDTWARPWSGTVDQKPMLDPESEPQFSYMLDHLEKYRIRDALQRTEGRAWELRRLAEKIEQDVPGDARETLSTDLLNAAVLYGSQLVETPEQKHPCITLTDESAGVTLRMDAFSVRFTNNTDAESAKDALRTVIDCVKNNPTTGKFFAARTEAQDELKRFAKVFEVIESVNFEIDQTTCIACVALVGFEQSASTPDTVV